MKVDEERRGVKERGDQQYRREQHKGDPRRSTYCRRRRKDEIKGEKKRSTQRRGDQ